eukprot:Sspe_Gene.15902::Locus_5553_Transcript_4_5_Confidence_0.286_Length_622::g.15902::m.15902
MNRLVTVQPTRDMPPLPPLHHPLLTSYCRVGAPQTPVHKAPPSHNMVGKGGGVKAHSKDVGIKAPPLDWTNSPTIPNLYTGPYPISYSSMKVGSFPSLVMPEGYKCEQPHHTEPV